MGYLTPEQRMKVSFRRHEVEATGKPFFPGGWSTVPDGYVSKTKAKELGKQVQKGQEPHAYVLSPSWNGYIALYDIDKLPDRKNKKQPE